MANRYEKRNESVIKRAFTRLQQSKDRVIEAGMKEMLNTAMLAALSFHDNTHWLHKSTANSYGWCVLHNGEMVSYGVNEGRHGDGNALSDMMAVSRNAKKEGWVGIVLAAMHGDRPMFFAADYEMWVLLLAADDTRENFGLFFNANAVSAV